MRKIKILTAHNVTGMGGVPAGAILDVDEYEARRKIAMGYAEAYVEPPAAEKTEDDTDETASKSKKTTKAKE